VAAAERKRGLGLEAGRARLREEEKRRVMSEVLELVIAERKRDKSRWATCEDARLRPLKCREELHQQS
jgi:hypothetical protein